MPQVTVTIAGHSYRIACGEGEEPHLEKLAALYDSKVEGMRASFGEMGDMRLHVMAAITLADELVEARRRLDGLHQELDQLKALASSEQLNQLVESKAAEAVARVAERIERLARSLNASQQPTSGP
jgi:cell division protein ZapA